MEAARVDFSCYCEKVALGDEFFPEIFYWLDPPADIVGASAQQRTM